MIPLYFNHKCLYALWLQMEMKICCVFLSCDFHSPEWVERRKKTSSGIQLNGPILIKTHLFFLGGRQIIGARENVHIHRTRVIEMLQAVLIQLENTLG